MTTVTILKHNGNYVYDDYTSTGYGFAQGKAIYRIRELTAENPVQVISRKKTSPVVVAAMVKKDWYDTKIAATPVPVKVTTVADDFVSLNFSNMINIINGTPETPAQVRKMVAEGPDQTNFSAYAIVDSKEFYRDGNEIVPYEDTPDVKIGGHVLAYLLSAALYTAIA